MASSGSSGARWLPHITGSREDLPMSNLNPEGSTSTPPGSARQATPLSLRPSFNQSPQTIAGPSLCSTTRVVGSSERLLRPGRTRAPHPYRDISDSSSRIPSAISSRRTSHSSDGGPSRLGPFATPFDDSRVPSRAGSIDGEGINTQTVSEKFNITPSEGLLLYPEDIEKDDWLHNPDPNEPDRERCDIWNRRGMMNIGGLALLTLGVLTLFIGYPILCVLNPSNIPGFVSINPGTERLYGSICPSQQDTAVLRIRSVFRTNFHFLRICAAGL
jgi:beta-glucan synthesis-associated protein KRE6